MCVCVCVCVFYCFSLTFVLSPCVLSSRPLPCFSLPFTVPVSLPCLSLSVCLSVLVSRQSVMSLTLYLSVLVSRQSVMSCLSLSICLCWSHSSLSCLSLSNLSVLVSLHVCHASHSPTVYLSVLVSLQSVMPLILRLSICLCWSHSSLQCSGFRRHAASRMLLATPVIQKKYPGLCCRPAVLCVPLTASFLPWFVLSPTAQTRVRMMQ